MNDTKTLSFIDSESRYKTLNRRVIYTAGIHALAEEREAFWLIDAIASYYGTKKMAAAIAADDRLETLQFWRLEVAADKAAELTAKADRGVTPFIVQGIPYTDFSLESVDIWAGFDGKYWTLYLSSEH